MARAPVSKTGGWGFEVPPLLPGPETQTSCQVQDGCVIREADIQAQ